MSQPEPPPRWTENKARNPRCCSITIKIDAWSRNFKFICRNRLRFDVFNWWSCYLMVGLDFFFVQKYWKNINKDSFESNIIACVNNDFFFASNFVLSISSYEIRLYEMSWWKVENTQKTNDSWKINIWTLWSLSLGETMSQRLQYLKPVNK